MIPVFASVALGVIHVVSNSFMVYLKYQAMVDAYYYREILGKEAK